MALSSLLLGTPAEAFDVSGLSDELAPSPAGTTQNDLARKHFDEALILYKQGKWRLSRFEFQASYDLSKSADLLHNLSMVAERQGLLADAVDFEERFRSAKTDLTAEDATQVQTRLERLRSAISAAPPSLSTQVAQSSSASHSERYRPPAGSIALMGLGAGLLVVGIGTGVGALSAQKQLSDAGYTSAEYDALLGRGRALNISAITFDVVGGVAGLGGLAWLVADRLRFAKSH